MHVENNLLLSFEVVPLVRFVGKLLEDVVVFHLQFVMVLLVDFETSLSSVEIFLLNVVTFLLNVVMFLLNVVLSLLNLVLLSLKCLVISLLDVVAKLWLDVAVYLGFVAFVSMEIVLSWNLIAISERISELVLSGKKTFS